MELWAILLYIIITLASYAVYLLHKNLNYWKNQGIPHDKPNLLAGNMKGSGTIVYFGIILANYYQKFKGTGPFAGFFMGPRPGVVLLEKQTIKHILIRDFSNFADRGLFHNEKSDPLTGHLARIDGEKWHRLRHKLSSTLTSGKMKYMYPTLLTVVNKFVAVLNEKVKDNSVVEVRDLLARFTVDIIGSVAFGIECNSLNTPEDNFLKFGRMDMAVPRHNALIMNFIMTFPKLARKMNMRIVCEDVHHFFMNTVTETVKYREENQIQRNDFLNILIEMKNSAKDTTALGAMSIEELAAQVYVFFTAGFETSSSTMAYALYELALNPDIQDRLREEIQEVYAQLNGSEVSYDTVMNMTYLDQVLSETLRKYPVVPFLIRQALNDYEIPDHPEYVIPKGSPVLIPVLGIHYDSEYYPNPDEFDPERFLPELVKQRDPMEWLAFGDGPRNCIGMRFGEMQSRLGLMQAIRHFRFTICSKTEIPITFDPKAQLLSPKNSVFLNVEAI